MKSLCAIERSTRQPCQKLNARSLGSGWNIPKIRAKISLKICRFQCNKAIYNVIAINISIFIAL